LFLSIYLCFREKIDAEIAQNDAVVNDEKQSIKTFDGNFIADFGGIAAKNLDSIEDIIDE
jgi:hypothetical protein